MFITITFLYCLMQGVDRYDFWTTWFLIRFNVVEKVFN